MPATVLAGLVQNGIHADLYYSDTLQRIDAAPFTRAWWYRTEFTLPPDYDDQRVWLHLDGINYRADIWLNGRRIAGADDVVGTFRQFEFDITQWVHAGAANALAVEVTPPDLANDLTLTWVDWNPAPPDGGMGIWRDVYLTRSGPVALRHPAVATKLDLPSLATAHLTVSAELTNTSAASVVVDVVGAIDDGAISFTQTITLAPSESKRVSFDEPQVPQLRLDHPKLWWPRDLGAPDRHRLVVTARVDNVVSDTQAIHFGIRQVSSQLTASGGRLFQINGKPLFVRGGAWAPDMLLRPNGKQMEAHVRYANDIGLNAIRLEGKLVGDELFDMLDANGMVAIVGWNCCDRWQDWPKWTAADHAIATASLRDQLLRLRNHSSVIDFLIGSDLAPPADVERELLAVVDETRWPNVVSSSAASTTTPLLGQSGFKMTGPYDWVAPSYWTLDTTRGGAYGFNTETSPGPAIPTL
ncbi:MAG TPA: hypothetical protein VKJ07_07830, partial [Mycobacteriales bacterium]|nr:hypothetical protein [Mycobacteriales bacterium]